MQMGKMEGEKRERGERIGFDARTACLARTACIASDLVHSLSSPLARLVSTPRATIAVAEDTDNTPVYEHNTAHTDHTA